MIYFLHSHEPFGHHFVLMHYFEVEFIAMRTTNIELEFYVELDPTQRDTWCEAHPPGPKLQSMVLNDSS